MRTKVIIIDDHPLFNDGLSLILKESGNYEVLDQIYDSREAYFKCYSLNPDLIIVDFNMPYMNGFEVVKQLKTLEKPFKIVILSMYADKREISMFTNVSIDGYLSKTTPAAEMIHSLRKIIDGEKIMPSGNERKAVYEKDYFSIKNLFTKRELEILKCLKRDCSTEQISVELGLSYYTVETHRKNINQKLKIKSKREFYEFLENLEL